MNEGINGLSAFGQYLSFNKDDDKIKDKYGLPVNEMGEVQYSSAAELISRFANIKGVDILIFGQENHRDDQDRSWVAQNGHNFKVNGINESFFEGYYKDSDEVIKKVIKEHNYTNSDPDIKIFESFIKENIEVHGSDYASRAENTDQKSYKEYAAGNGLVYSLVKVNEKLKEHFPEYKSPGQEHLQVNSNLEYQPDVNLGTIIDFIKTKYVIAKLLDEKTFSEMNGKLQTSDKTWTKIQKSIGDNSADISLSDKELKKLSGDIELLHDTVKNYYDKWEADNLGQLRELRNVESAKVIAGTMKRDDKAILLWGAGHFKECNDMDEMINEYRKVKKQHITDFHGRRG